MIDPTGNVGGVQGLSSSGVEGAVMLPGAGGQQLGQIVSALAQEFGGYASQEQIATLQASLRLLVGAGLPLPDVAEAMYSNPVALDAMRGGQPELAKQAIVQQLNAALSELRGSSVPQTSLRELSESGFAVAQIASAIRNLPAVREALTQADAAVVKQAAAMLHEYLRDSGRAMHLDTAMMEAFGALCAGQGLSFEQYATRIRAAQKRVIGDVRGDEHPEIMLVPPADSASEVSSNSGAWLLVTIVAVAILLLIASRC